MDWNVMFFVNAILLGVGLAMDAFSVSLANGLRAPHMGAGKMCTIAGTFGAFQAAMPLLGWVCVHTIVELFSSFEKFIPWIALILLGYIGGKMLIEGIKGEEAEEAAELSAGALFMQGVATSIDALAVGVTFSMVELSVSIGLAVALIGCTTFLISLGGVYVGNVFGAKYKNKAEFVGGTILILIGVKIILEHFGVL